MPFIFSLTMSPSSFSTSSCRQQIGDTLFIPSLLLPYFVHTLSIFSLTICQRSRRRSRLLWSNHNTIKLWISLPHTSSCAMCPPTSSNPPSARHGENLTWDSLRSCAYGQIFTLEFLLFFQLLVVSLFSLISLGFGILNPEYYRYFETRVSQVHLQWLRFENSCYLRLDLSPLFMWENTSAGRIKRWRDLQKGKFVFETH